MLKMNIIGCGAGGIKTINSILPKLNMLNELVDINFIGIDGSESVKFDSLNEFYMPEDASGKKLSGSGGNRAANHERFKPFVKDLFNGPLSRLLKHNDGEVNVVISSLGGGSGAMLANNIVNTLIKNKASCWYIGIADYRTEKTRKSTYKQLATMYNLPRLAGEPLIVSIAENKAGITDGNNEVERLLTLFTYMASGDNYNLDVNDMVYATAINRYTDLTIVADVYQLYIYTVRDLHAYKFKPVEFSRVLSKGEFEIRHAERDDKSGFLKSETIADKFFAKEGVNGIILDLDIGVKDDVLEAKKNILEKEQKLTNDSELFDAGEDGVLV